jgi:transcriptional regulator with XRE-family HTH domain
MRQSPVSQSHLTLARPTVVADRIIAFLRHVHPVKTVENVAADAGIPGGTVAKWLERGSAPNAAAIFKLLQAYGAPFACAAMESPPAWLSAAAREDEKRRLRAEIAALQARLEGEPRE